MIRLSWFLKTVSLSCTCDWPWELCSFEVIEDLTDNVEMPVSVNYCLRFSKGDKLELVTQKVTELGAQAIWAFLPIRSVVKWDGKKLKPRRKMFAKIALYKVNNPSVIVFQKSDWFEKKREISTWELYNFDKILSPMRKQPQVSYLARELPCRMVRKFSLSFDQKVEIFSVWDWCLEEAGGVKIDLDLVLCGRKLPSLLWVVSKALGIE